MTTTSAPGAAPGRSLGRSWACWWSRWSVTRWAALVPVVLLGVVAACDAVLLRGAHGVPLTAALDWPAHEATAALLLLAVLGRRALRHPGLLVATLAGAVALDLDHVALYAGVPGVSAGGRPFTHSLGMVALLGAAVAAVVVASAPAPARRRALAARLAAVLAALAVGVALHLVRDLGTGPGVVLWWPLSLETVRVAYAVYGALLVVAAATATVRLARGAEVTARSRREPRTAPGSATPA